MGIICNCPLGAALPDIPVDACTSTMGQIQKVAFQRVIGASGAKNKFSASPATKAIWTPGLQATDGTKIVVSPYIYGPTSEPGAAKTYGGSNETLGGIELIIGREPTSFTANFLQTDQAAIKAIKDLQCENLGVFLFDENGQIGCLKVGEEYMPVPIAGFFVGDKSFGNLDAPDTNGVQWKFFPNWSDNFVIVSPTDFNPLTDLVKTTE